MQSLAIEFGTVQIDQIVQQPTDRPHDLVIAAIGETSADLGE